MRSFTLSALVLGLHLTGAKAQTVQVSLKDKGTDVMISRHIYGQFAEHLGRSIYDGFYRNGKIQTGIVEALKKIRIPNLRWPGGCFADQYHWRDGIGPFSKRPVTINTTWGMVKEDNTFGTHEFLQLCEMLNTEPYIAGNVGTGSAQEMKDWVEYLNLKDSSQLADLRAANGHPAPYNISFWGVGNESWGCGGNMTPEYYADLYKQFAAFCPDYPGTKLKKIIGGANADDYNWTEVIMQRIKPNQAWGLSLHYYTIPTGNWDKKGSATSFDEQQYAHTLKAALKMETIVSRNEEIMDKYDPKKELALTVDEWGIWTDTEPGTPGYGMFQQNSLRDALIAASTLNIFNNHAARVRGANLAQTVNVIHSLILTKGDQHILTPTYHVFDLFKVHQDAMLIPLAIESPLYIKGNDSVNAVNLSASKDSAGITHITLTNLDPNKPYSIKIPLTGKFMSGQLLSSGKVTDINTFTQPDKLKLQVFKDVKTDAKGIVVQLPAKSVVALALK